MKKKVTLDLSNYVTKSYIKNVRGVDASDFAKKTDLANLKSEVNELDVNKLETVPVNLSKQRI